MSFVSFSLKEENALTKFRQGTNIDSQVTLKSSLLKSTPRFHELEPQTNLNQPPSNWLIKDERLNFPQRFMDSSNFSSFNIAEKSLDSIGSVDVVSDAENIKTLLKMPYSNSNISMAVHRIGNTLLLDKVDVLKTPNKKDKPKTVPKKKNPKNTQHQVMYSKFLYHSIEPSSDDSQIDSSIPDTGYTTLVEHFPPQIPKPEKETKFTFRTSESDSSSSNSYPLENFLRIVEWSFQDITMLVGSNLSIFGDEKHPAVSLRLRDASRPINVLTGLDCWLDNLMCNVPEIAMCFHLNGIVQGYELFKTEDLPNLENSAFSPSVVQDTAENLLQFLKRNCTREGGTYWLYRDEGDDVVKLYDLSDLSEGPWSSNDNNPFGVPVAMLLYRVARNMKQSQTENDNATIFRLLMNCLQILKQSDYPEIYSAACSMIVELLLLPVPDFDPSDFMKIREGDDNEKRFFCALNYLGSSLACLPSIKNEETNISSENQLIVQQSNIYHFGPLLFQISQAYFGLAHSQSEKRNFSSTLAFLYCSSKALDISSQTLTMDAQLLESQILSLWADASFNILKYSNGDLQNFENERKNYENERKIQQELLPSFSNLIRQPLSDFLEKKDPFDSDLENRFKNIIDCYQDALSLCLNHPLQLQNQISLKKKIASVQNELGLLYMKLQKYNEAETFFKKAIEKFQDIGDFVNIALIHCNLGRLVRLGWDWSNTELTQEEIDCNKTAINYYSKAKDLLLQNETNKKVLDNVNEELARAKFSFACLLQDRPPLELISQRELEKETSDLFFDALKHYEKEHEKLQKLQENNQTPKSLHWISQRVANIHHRLASMHHNTVLSSGSELKNLKQLLSLSELHYKKALNIYKPDTSPYEYFKIQLELSRLCEYSTNENLSLKNLTQSWEHLLNCRFVLQEPNSINNEALEPLIPILEKKLQILLRDFIKSYTLKKNLKKSEAFKKIYSYMLTQQSPLQEKLQRIFEIYETECI